MDLPLWSEIGGHAKIDPGVTLGYRYPGDKEPLRIGDHAVIRSGTIIYTDSAIGSRFSCGHQVLIRAHCTIGDRVVVHHQCTLEGRVRVGHGVKIMAQVYIPSTTVIGNMVFIGPGTTFLNDKYPMRRKAPVSGAKIGDHVTIGGGVTICPEVTIGNNVFVGAGTLVNKDIPPNMLAYGVPVRWKPLPEGVERGNLPELLLPQTDLWGAQRDDTWQEDVVAHPERYPSA